MVAVCDPEVRTPILYQDEPRAHGGSAYWLGKEPPFQKDLEQTLSLEPAVCPLCGEVGGKLVGNRVCSQRAQEGFQEEMG